MIINITISKQTDEQWNFTGKLDLANGGNISSVKISLENGMVLFTGDLDQGIKQLSKWLSLFKK